MHTQEAHTWTALFKPMDRFSLSSMSELVSVQSDSGRADPRTMITWICAKVAQCLCLLLTDCMFMLKNHNPLVFEPHVNDGTLTNLHNERI